MKIVHLKNPVPAEDLRSYIETHVNESFKERRQIDLDFDYTLSDNSIEIRKADLYDDFLFKIDVNGNELNITKSEHYTDDVNVLTLEDLLNTTLLAYPGRDDVDYVGERS